MPGFLRSLLDPNVLLENSTIFAILLVFLTIYSPRLAPKLPEPILSLFESAIFRAFVLFLVVYLSSRDARISLLIVIVFMVSLNVVNMDFLQEDFKAERFKVEKFTNIYGPPVANCSNYPAGQGEAMGNYYYPLNDTNDARGLRKADVLMPFADEPVYSNVILPEPVEEGLGN